MIARFDCAQCKVLKIPKIVLTQLDTCKKVFTTNLTCYFHYRMSFFLKWSTGVLRSPSLLRNAERLADLLWLGRILSATYRSLSSDLKINQRPLQVMYIPQPNSKLCEVPVAPRISKLFVFLKSKWLALNNLNELKIFKANHLKSKWLALNNLNELKMHWKEELKWPPCFSLLVLK